MTSSNNKLPFQMIVFDKDGTLGNDQASLVKWVQHMTNQVEMELLDLGQKQDILPMIQQLHAALGFCNIDNSLLPSAPVASATWEEILQICVTHLQAFGVQEATTKVPKWHEAVKNLHGQDPPLIENMPGLMLHLKQEYGLQIAICTSDDRSGTDLSIQNWKLTNLVDYSICGDEVTNGKPSTEPILALCKQAGVKPSECIMVGDTTADTGMGKNAGMGLVIGVLSGSGTKEQLLATGATVILQDIGKIPEYLESSSTTMAN